MKALITGEGETLQCNDIEYVEHATHIQTGERGWKIEYANGETSFMLDGTIEGVYTDVRFDPDVHTVDTIID